MKQIFKIGKYKITVAEVDSNNNQIPDEPFRLTITQSRKVVYRNSFETSGGAFRSALVQLEMLIKRPV